MVYLNKQATVGDVQDFISWLETQSGPYDSQDPDNCPIAKYLRARGHTEVSFHGMYELQADGNNIDLPKIIGEIVYGTNDDWSTWLKRPNYQNALERARKLYVDMIYAIKPSEDPGAASINHPDQVDDPNLPTDDD